MHGLRALVGGAALARAQIWSRHLAPLHTSASSAAGRPDDDGGDDPDSHMMIPWVRTVISGVGIMRHPKYNKGLAFTQKERTTLHLRGLLPPAVLSLETQMQRVMINIRMKVSDLERYSYMQSLQERNEYLYFKVVREHIDELLPVVHLPTVRQACKTYGLMFKSLPRCLFITRQDLGNVRQVLKNWPERRIKVVVITDGQQVGPAGDLGVHAVNAAIAKLSLMTALGGLAPSLTLPILVDHGTNNEELLKSQFYSGLRHRRISGDLAQELMHDIMSAIENRFGNNTVVFFEDMKYRTCQKLLSQYRLRFPCYSDDYQGFAAAVLAATLGALPDTGRPLHEQRILILGSGPYRVSMAEMLTAAMAQSSRKMMAQARESVFLADPLGLVTTTSEHTQLDDDEMQETLLYAKDVPNIADMEAIVAHVKPTVLISCTADARRMTPITEGAVREMSKHTRRPIIFALSSPAAELTAAQAYHWTEGQAMFANFEGVQEEVTTPDGNILTPSKVQSVYIFPGLALGTCVTRAQSIKESQLIEAAKAVATMVDDDDRRLGRVLPPTEKLHAVAKRVGLAVARAAYDAKIATALPKPTDLEATIEEHVYGLDYATFA